MAQTFTWVGNPGSLEPADTDTNWSPLGPPNTGDTAIVNAGSLLLTDSQISQATVYLESATLEFISDTGVNSGPPTLDNGSLISTDVSAVETPPGTPQQTVLQTFGGFVNQGTILAAGPAGSSFTLSISGITLGGTYYPGYFLNQGQIEADAGNTLTIAIGGTSELFNPSAIVAKGGTVIINAAPDAIAGGYGPVVGFGLIEGGGTFETNVTYTSTTGGTAPYFAFADPSSTGNTLKIDHITAFGGRILGFQAGDTIDLGTSLAVAQGVYDSSTGILALEDSGGTVLASLSFVTGGFQSGTFTVDSTTGALGTSGFSIITLGTDTALTSTAQLPLSANSSGTWQDAASWSTGSAPASSDTPLIGLGASSDFTLTTGAAPVSAAGLVLVSKHALLQITSATTAGPYTISDIEGVLEVTAGQTLTASSLRAFTDQATVLVDSGALLDLTGHKNVGFIASNGSISVSNGNTFALAVNGGSLLVDGGTLNAGPQGTVGTGGAIQIGLDGAGSPGTVVVQSGGTVIDTYALLSSDPTSFGSLTLTGSGTSWSDEIDPKDTVTTRGFMVIGSNNEAGNVPAGVSVPPYSGAAQLLVTSGATLNEQTYAIIAQNIDSAGTATVQSGGVWNIGTATGGFLQVGLLGTGALSVLAGGTVAVGGTGTFVTGGVPTTAGGIAIGVSAGATGTAQVDGAGALLTSAAGIAVGRNGSGSLAVLNGGTVSLTGNGLNVGVNAGASGSLSVGGTSGTALVSFGAAAGGLTIGQTGTGTANVQAGGSIALNGTGGLTIGQSTGAAGTLVISGTSLSPGIVSLGIAAGGISVGRQGTGTLVVNGGGTLTENAAGKGIGIGQSLGGSGLLLVTSGGVITQGTSAAGIGVGQGGSGTLEVLNGGTVSVVGGVAAGATAGRSGTVQVSGSGALLQLSGTAALLVGVNATGVMTIDNTARVTTAGGLGIGQSSGSQGTLTVNGGTLASTGAFNIGSSGQGTLLVQGGGSVSSTGTAGQGFDIGLNGSGSGLVNVTNGTLSVSAPFIVGQSGQGQLIVGASGTVAQTSTTFSISIGSNTGGSGTVTVNSGGLLTSADGISLGFNSGSSGTLVVNGGSVSETGNLMLGGTGSGSVAVQSGGTLTSIGSLGPAVDINASGTASVSGGTWNLSGQQLVVGDSGSGSLDISNNGVVNAGTAAVDIGNQGSGVGTISLESVGQLIAGNLIVSSFAATTKGTLLVAGGTVQTGSLTENGGGGITVSSGLLNDTGVLTVGQNGTGAAMTVSGGSVIAGNGLNLGSGVGGSGTLTVSGGQISSNGINVGNNGSGTLNVTGGTISNSGSTFLQIAAFSSSSTGTVSVTNGLLAADGGISVGTSGSGQMTTGVGGTVTETGFSGVQIGSNAGATGTLTVNTGGQLQAASIGLGAFAGSGNGTLVVNGGSVGDGALNVAAGGALLVEGGGTLTNTVTAGFAAIINAATGGASAVVSNGTWILNNQLIVGDNGAGSLDINSNGLVNLGTATVTLGNQSGGSGTVSLESGGQLNAGSLWVSTGFGGGSSGTLLVAGGTVQVGGATANGGGVIQLSSGTLSDSGFLNIGQSGTGAAVTVSGGSLSADNISLGEQTGTSGTLAVSGGHVSANAIDVGGNGTGSLAITGGTVDISVTGLGLDIGTTSTAASGFVTVSAGRLAIGSGLKVGTGGSGQLTIGNAGIVTQVGMQGVQIGSGGTITVNAGGEFLAQPSMTPGGLSVSGVLAINGGIATDGVLSMDAGGTVLVQSGGTLTTSFTPYDPGLFFGPVADIDGHASGTAFAVVNGGTWNLDDQLIIGDLGGGSLDIGAGGLVNAGTAMVDIGNQAGGSGTVSVSGAGAMLEAGTLVIANMAGANASLTIGSGGTVSVQRIFVNDRLTLSGGVVSATGSSSNFGTISGFGTFMGQLTDGGQIVVSGGTLEVTGLIDGTGTIGITGGAAFQADDVLGNNQTVEFANSTTAANLILGSLQSVNDFTIGNWQNGDAILFNNGVTVIGEQWLSGTLAVFTSVGTYDFTHVTLAAGTLPVFASTANSVELISCFAANTLIETEHGPVPVERLREGDRVRTCIAEAWTPIIWMGWREVDCAAHPKPQTVWPVRIAAGAFGPAMPARDLWLSPDHAVFVNDVLIPVKQLINGSTIVQVPRDRVTYYHLELPQHDVVLAEGLPAESYLDVGDRSNFASSGGPVRLHPDFSLAWEGQGAAPLVVTGPELAAVRQALAEQAAVLGVQAA